MKNLANKIKQLRKEAGMTAMELAERSGLSPAYISKLEGGKYQSLSLKTSKALADGLSLTLRELLESINFLEKDNQLRPGPKLIAEALRRSGYSRAQERKVLDYAELVKQSYKMGSS